MTKSIQKAPIANKKSENTFLNHIINLFLCILVFQTLVACQTVTDEDSKSNNNVAENGTFKGTMTQSDGKAFPMELKGANPILVEYPTLGCIGQLVLVTRDVNEVTFREEISRGSCINEGIFKTTMSDRDVINLTWSKDGETLTASATLYRNGNIPDHQSDGLGNVAAENKESQQSPANFDFNLISRDPAKYILAETVVNGKPSDPYNNTCDSWYCLTKGTSQEVHLPFEIRVSLKQPYRDQIVASGKKIQVKIAPDFISESIENGKKVTQKGSLLYKDRDVYYGSIFKSYELSPENSYSVTVQHEARVPLLVKFDNGTSLETHDVKGTVTEITRAREGSRYDTAYGN